MNKINATTPIKIPAASKLKNKESLSFNQLIDKLNEISELLKETIHNIELFPEVYDFNGDESHDLDDYL